MTRSAAVEDYTKAIYSLERRCDGAVSTNDLADRMGVKDLERFGDSTKPLTIV